ncbi:MAG: PAS domain S-box protein [Deltaproteobacteria bacterium]|nr:PAS domain S-box protein [Deltaproteobacteria bacterium]
MSPILSRLRKSLAWKMGFSVGTILLLSIGTFTYFNIYDLREQLLNRLKLRGDRFSETVQRSTRFGMLLNDREHVLKIIEALGNQEGIERIRVFSKKGVIMYSSWSQEVGSALTKQDAACNACHGTSQPLEKLSLSQRARLEKGTGLKHALSIITPIPNEPSCYTAACHAHAPEERKLGLLEVTMSLVRLDDEVRRNIVKTVLFDLSLFAFITAVVVAYILFFVNRPIKKLLLGTRQIGSGTRREAIVVRSVDEIGDLAKAFDEMSERIYTYTQDLEKMVGDRTEDFRKSEEKYRLIFQGSQNGILLFDITGSLSDINLAGINLLGYESKREALQKVHVNHLFLDRAEWPALLQEIQKAGVIREVETHLRVLHRPPMEALLSGNVLKDAESKVIGYVLLLKDITESKRAERALLKEKKTIEGILEGSPIATFVLDRDRRVTHWNRACELLTGKKKEEMIGTRSQWQAFYKEERPVMADCIVQKDLALLRQYYGDRELKESSLIPGAYEAEDFFPRLGQGGRQIFFLSAPITDPEGETQGAITTLQDVTEQRQAEALIRRNIAEIARAYDELKSTQEQLIQSARLASLGKLAATIAHEINNPLAGVLNYIKLLIKFFQKDTIPPERMDDIRGFLAIMERETARCGGIVKNLLSFSRPSVVRKEPAQVNDIIEQALSILTHKIEISGVQLQKNLAPDLPPVTCDAKQIQQALMNIIINGVEAMPQGGTLTIASRRLPAEKMIAVEIRDTGVGIPKEHLDTLFEPFFSTKAEGKGVGLGLSVSYGIISKHQGIIKVESEPGRGTAFQVQLPYLEKEGAPADAGSRPD